jgi:hypothetical protein
MLEKDPDWCQSRFASALSHRLCGDEQEDQLLERIKTNILQEIPFDCDKDFKLDAV